MKPQPRHVSPSGDINLLQSSEDDHQLFDAIDQLRHLGIHTNAELPQIVVVGSQSSGKSSVIDALCRFNVPKKSAVCTRFALEIGLRHAVEPNWSVDLIPSPDRTTGKRAELKAFGATVKSHFIDPQKQLGEIVRLAEETLGLTNSTGMKKFANDILRLKWYGPDLLNLDLVDLPGLFHGQGANQSVDDAPYVLKLVERYMARPSTITLAVISARDNIANQQVTALVTKYDKQGTRTVGIITKPDDVDGPELQQEVIDLAKNETFPLRCGYHILKNRSWKNQDDSNDKRDHEEARFLAKAPYDVIPSVNKGITNLGPKLTKLYREHIMKSLPEIVRDGQSTLQSLQAKLMAENPMNTSLYNRDRFVDIGNNVIYRMSEIIDGRYDDPSLDSTDVHIRVNETIEKLMGAIVLPAEETYKSSQDEELINRVLIKYTSHDNPGQFDIQLAKRLCREQTQEWPRIAKKLISDIITACENCVGSVLTNMCSDEDMAREILEIVCLPITDNIQKDFLEDLQAYLPQFEERDRSQIFAKATIATAIKSARTKEAARLVQHVRRTESQSNNESSPLPRTPRTPRASLRTRSNVLEDDNLLKAIEDEIRLDRTTVAEAVECSRLHCQLELQRIISYFNMHKVNAQLWKPFKDAFQPGLFRDLTDAQIDRIMGENEEAKEKKRLQQEEIKELQQIIGRLQGYGAVVGTKSAQGSKRKAKSPTVNIPRRA